MFNSVQGGFIGNIAGNPFGSDFVVPQQRRPVPGGPQMAPLKQPPARVFPPDQPGREGAIDVRLAMGMPGMNIGNMAGMSGTFNPSSRYLQQPNRNTQGVNTGRRQEPDVVQEPEEEVENPLVSGTLNPFSGYMRALANMQNTAKEAGFDRKTVS